MTETTSASPAAEAAQLAVEQVYEAIDSRQNFRLEAGAGSGKTHTLVQALHHIIKKHGRELLRRQQRVACITYTNVATDEIAKRTDGHPVVLASTIHSFCWTLIRRFQSFLREHILELNKWEGRIEEVGGIGDRGIDYDLGIPFLDDQHAYLSHNDVLAMMVKLLNEEKFGRYLTSCYPIVFIDEYQDTNKEVAAALVENFIEPGVGPLIGIFGDHWQKIYGDGCGLIDYESLTEIKQGANFRSVQVIVDVLNKMRPDLPQEIGHVAVEGTAAVYHTNSWRGTRQTGGHWGGDLPTNEAHTYRSQVEQLLQAEGWDFSPEKTKILMLTHNVLAAEQGYANLVAAFRYNDQFLKKENDHFAFLADKLEPMCAAYEEKKYGEMFRVLGRPAIQSKADKDKWTALMDKLCEIRRKGTIGDVLEVAINGDPDIVPPEVREVEVESLKPPPEDDADEPSAVRIARKLRDVPYAEVVRLRAYIEGHTPFSTKHGVKGAEFENVLVVLGRGWNRYNFGGYLEWRANGTPPGKEDTFERNQNLLYVCCSRAKKRLALLFTQELSEPALATLSDWFGGDNVHALDAL